VLVTCWNTESTHNVEIEKNIKGRTLVSFSAHCVLVTRTVHSIIKSARFIAIWDIPRGHWKILCRWKGCGNRRKFWKRTNLCIARIEAHYLRIFMISVLFSRQFSDFYNFFTCFVVWILDIKVNPNWNLFIRIE